MYRIAINHQENVPPKWHHKDGWPRKVIRCRITAEDLILSITDLRGQSNEVQRARMRLLTKWAPNLTLQTVLAILEDRYLYVTDWEPAPHGMIITFPAESETVSVPANCHARRLT